MDQGVQAFISFYNSSSRAVRQMVWLLLRAVSWLSRFTIGRRERRCVARRTRVRGGGEGDWPYVLNITYINCCCARTHAANVHARMRMWYRRPRTWKARFEPLVIRESNRSNGVARTAAAARTCLCMRKRKWGNKFTRATHARES